MSSSTAQHESMARCMPIPRGEKRRREIAAVAERVFFAHGFTDTTMQTIAAEAGASKETLYRHFGSKEGLFSEIVEHRAERFLESLDENLQRPGTVAEVLSDLGLKMLDAMIGSEALCLVRIVIAERPRNPELGQIFYTQGPERLRKRLAQFLSVATDRGELRCGDPLLAAKIFLGAILSQYHIDGLVLSDPPVVSKAQMRAHTDEVVAMFLRHYQV